MKFKLPGLFKLIFKEDSKTAYKILTIAMISGLFNGFVAITINIAARNISEEEGSLRLFLMFAFGLTAFIYCKKIALLKSHKMVQTIIGRIRTRVSEKIRHAELRLFEGIGKDLFFTTLSRETQSIGQSTTETVNAASAIVMLVFCFIYMFVISSTAFFMVVAILLLGIILYNISIRYAKVFLQRANVEENLFFKTLNHLLGGFIEVKMNSKKGEDLMENYLIPSSKEVVGLKINMHTQFVNSFIISNTFAYFILGTIVFALPSLMQTGTISSLTPQTIIELTTVVLFFVSPLEEVVGCIPVLTISEVAIDNIQKLENDLDSVVVDDHRGKSLLATRSSFEEVKFENLSFHYRDRNDKVSFSVGPFDYSVKPGQITFIVGGNGSGKSTMMKLITGLYTASEGCIRADNREITESNIQDYRDNFAVIFGNFHLFDRLYGVGEVDLDKLYSLLNEFELSDKTEFIDGQFTNIDLSTGQKKRLALITSILEDKPIYVFDEWAADQDPNFRKYFYEVILADLKKRNKIVIAVSHDDRYFHHADQVLKMEYGQIIKI